VVSGLLAAIPGMLSIVVMLTLVLYVGAVLAVELYADVAPQYFDDLGTSLFTLFQVMTGEAWPDIAKDVMSTHPSAWIFFVLFILVSTFIVLNLFTAVVVSAMEPERDAEVGADAAVVIELRELRAEIAALRARIDGPLAPSQPTGDP
jgi:voltage-gated sodium channel